MKDPNKGSRPWHADIPDRVERCLMPAFADSNVLEPAK